MSLVQKRYVVWLAIIALAAGIGWYVWGQGSTPLTSLRPNNFDQFRSAFDKDPQATRVVLLLSPT